jgi:hypothetical protein
MSDFPSLTPQLLAEHNVELKYSVNTHWNDTLPEELRVELAVLVTVLEESINQHVHEVLATCGLLQGFRRVKHTELREDNQGRIYEKVLAS